MVCIGHGATIHAASIEDGSLVGMGATVLDGATVNQPAHQSTAPKSSPERAQKYFKGSASVCNAREL